MEDDKALDVHLKAVGEKLKQLRLNSEFDGGYVGFSIHEVGMQPKQYWKLEAGTTNFTIKTLLKVLAVHKLTLEEFFKGL